MNTNYDNHQGFNKHTGFSDYPNTNPEFGVQQQQEPTLNPGQGFEVYQSYSQQVYADPAASVNTSPTVYDSMHGNPQYSFQPNQHLQQQQPQYNQQQQQQYNQQQQQQQQQQNMFPQQTNLPQMFTQNIASAAIKQMAGQAMDYNQQSQLANMAMNYGTDIVSQSGGIVQNQIKTAVISSNLKYYFAVDTKYVIKKLLLLIFPFHHKKWSIRYDENTPVAPRHEVNAPDLYIPVMAFVTFILMTGICLGIKDKFTPELLGITASSLLVYLIVEILLLLFVTYMMRVSTDLKYLDLFSYCGYKYVSMIVCLVVSIFFKSNGYYISLAWCSMTMCFFLVRALKHAIAPHSNAINDNYNSNSGHKNRLYTLAIIAFIQPVLIWWQTKHLYIF